MTHHLFVYGTLLSTAGHRMGARLMREARLVGAATLPGRLYRLGDYPGLAEVKDGAGIVHGEVFALPDPVAALVWLDAYEGLQPDDPDGGEYRRVQRMARLASGAEVGVWVYLYQRDVAGLVPIDDGRWR
jgi:gamma-glutamylcyclotransferase (GGCT)/AIG2-like uncharacterized protein YtfP